jgi:hypothetical protein
MNAMKFSQQLSAPTVELLDATQYPTKFAAGGLMPPNLLV